MTDAVHTHVQPTSVAPRKHILLVEDEVVIALAAATELADAGYEVVTATDGLAGLAAVRERPFDLIVTDYMMPRMHGLAMIEAMRAAGVAVPIILATSIGEERLMPRAGRTYDAYLAKPYRFEVLLGLVRQLAEAETATGPPSRVRHEIMV